MPCILSIDEAIRNTFKEEQKQLDIYTERLSNIDKSIQKLLPGNNRLLTILQTNRSVVEAKIDVLQTNDVYNMYILETSEMIHTYKRMLSTPCKQSFCGKKLKSDPVKKSIIAEYLQFASQYATIDTEHNAKPIVCSNCSNTKEFDIIDNTLYVCPKCYARQIVVRYTPSYKDISRVNLTGKYTYDRKSHFRDCVNQYQGKQNSVIPDTVYEGLIQEFDNHHLLVGDSSTPKSTRYKNITKKHILLFLKELGLPKHYENVHLIHSNITGIQPPDIRKIEEVLMIDFDRLSELYDKRFKHVKRKNFINTQYVLYQLLHRHKQEYVAPELIILKTTDRKCFHDNVCRKLFEELGWNHTPLY